MRHELHLPGRHGQRVELPVRIVIELTPVGVLVEIATEGHQGDSRHIQFTLTGTDARDLAAVLTMEAGR